MAHQHTTDTMYESKCDDVTMCTIFCIVSLGLGETIKQPNILCKQIVVTGTAAVAVSLSFESFIIANANANAGLRNHGQAEGPARCSLQS